MKSGIAVGYQFCYADLEAFVSILPSSFQSFMVSAVCRILCKDFSKDLDAQLNR